jgi:hypothetical protein
VDGSVAAAPGASSREPFVLQYLDEGSVRRPIRQPFASADELGNKVRIVVRPGSFGPHAPLRSGSYATYHAMLTVGAGGSIDLQAISSDRERQVPA